MYHSVRMEEDSIEAEEEDIYINIGEYDPADINNALKEKLEESSRIGMTTEASKELKALLAEY